ncbi:S9 family peptidase [Natronocalculus amylovorans]|uniref:Acyl-peptide hydrolase n=1 Tax=Natronocalculus amylovorans TaxID=2917812 RepID=A0AAE3K6L3_9EURY|nr:S9 family peptidase [Natronocalculus amylovorans]MCL9815352.1 S9 family peptidase [Natronocalculus amylovorans]
MSDYDIERYLNIRSAYGANFSPDGDRLAFLMNTTGTGQLWSVDGAGQWPQQHTFYDERVTFARYSPTRPEIIFGMDDGGNERAQLYRVETESGSITNLTQRPGAKHRWGGWSHDGERFAFTSNRRDTQVFDIYVQDRDATGGDAEVVFEGDGWLTLGGWSPDDKKLLVIQSYSNFDQDLSVFNLETSELTHVTPHEGNVRYRSPEWGPDGESIYLCADRETDTLRLERIDLKDESFAAVETDGAVPETDWNVNGVAIDTDTSRVVYSTNVDGYGELTVGKFTGPDSIDTTTEPQLPNGVVGGVSFGPDAEEFAVTVTASTQNTNVYVIDVETGESTQWTDAATAGIPSETFVDPELVRYPTFDDRRIPGFFSLPESDTGSGEIPVIVDIHGGPESQRRPSFSPVKQFLLQQGYGVFEPNVRGSAGYGKEYAGLDDVEKRMDAVADIKSAVEWLCDHPAVDPDRIVAMGGSYGGFMVLSALTEYPEFWAAGIDIVGIANFVTFLENTGEWRRSLREAEYGSLEDDRSFLESISPINNMESIDAPLFVLHGANDPRVPVGEAEQVVEAARDQNVPVRKLIFDDEGHGFSKLANRIEAYDAIVAFLEEHV